MNFTPPAHLRIHGGSGRHAAIIGSIWLRTAAGKGIGLILYEFWKLSSGVISYSVWRMKKVQVCIGREKAEPAGEVCEQVRFFLQSKRVSFPASHEKSHPGLRFLCSLRYVAQHRTLFSSTVQGIANAYLDQKQFLPLCSVKDSHTDLQRTFHVRILPADII